MKFLLTIILLTVALSAQADNQRVPPANKKPIQTINSLKQFIKGAKTVTRDYERVLNSYAQAFAIYV